MITPINIKGSIRRRLLIMLLGGALVLALGLFFVFQRLAVQLAEESQDNILRASATAILDSASVVDGEIQIDLPYSAFSMLSNVSNDRVFYAIKTDQTFLTGYDDLPFPPAPESGNHEFATETYQDETVRVVVTSRAMTTGENPVRLFIALAQTQDGQASLIARVVRISAWVGFGVFVLVVALALITAKATVAPLVRLTESVSRRGPSELRAVAAPVPVEMVPLVTSLNSFMDRLSNSLSRTEEFIADAAHRLRTPLAIVRTRAETTLMRVEREENRAALKDMIRAIDESSRAAGQMLDHAMVSLRTDSLMKAQLNLSDIVSEIVGRMTPAAELRDIQLKFRLDENVTFPGDPVLVQSALRNVIDNALKFSPVDSCVQISAGTLGQFAFVKVQDEGGGFPTSDLETIIKRFSRGENAEGIVGSGLGLTIASDVAKAHGGTLEIENAQEAGACVSLYFSLV
ncbi:MAG: sensor histidine kinase [Paracoccaceae bacterium]|jgi:two-component system sensor histidine kinase TctE|nr:sensor histidine kinase [Paracoccaceae bacterium]MDP7184546.1 sensor histidine kinase [Paracoccaceae bacterium]